MAKTFKTDITGFYQNKDIDYITKSFYRQYNDLSNLKKIKTSEKTFYSAELIEWLKNDLNESIIFLKQFNENISKANNPKNQMS